jgi:hypothetical protein
MNSRLGKRDVRLRGRVGRESQGAHCIGRNTTAANPRRRISCGCCSEFIRPCGGLHDIPAREQDDHPTQRPARRMNSRLGKRDVHLRGRVGRESQGAHCMGRNTTAANPQRRISCGCCSEFIRPCDELHDIPAREQDDHPTQRPALRMNSRLGERDVRLRGQVADGGRHAGRLRAADGRFLSRRRGSARDYGVRGASFEMTGLGDAKG